MVVGVWADSGTIAFAWCILHHHGLLHRALDGGEHTLGRGPPPPPPPIGAGTGVGGAAGDGGDVDPLRGLHDYSLTIELDGLGKVQGAAGTSKGTTYSNSNAVFSAAFPHLVRTV